jgi:glutamine synthetase
MREIGIHEAETLRLVNENDLKFIRLTTCDISGKTKNISILPGMLQSTFLRGMTFDSSRIDGFEQGGELLLFPETSGLSVLPWRPTDGRVARIFCEVCRPDGTIFEGDPRAILKRAVKAAASAGLAFIMGTENEFYLFRTDEKGNPTSEPLDYASYLDIAPEDKGENIRREICLNLEQMGVTPEKSFHEEGPGQNEIVFHGGDPLTAADHFMTYKMVVRTLAARNGLYASFDPKPIADQAGSGLRIRITLLSHGITSADLKDVAAFCQGVNQRLSEISLFLNSSPKSYQRLTSGSVQIGARITDVSEITLDHADLLLNPYLAFSLLIYAGLEGIEQAQNGILPENTSPILPSDYEEALEKGKNSQFVQKYLPAQSIKRYWELRKKELTDTQSSPYSK